MWPQSKQLIDLVKLGPYWWSVWNSWLKLATLFLAASFLSSSCLQLQYILLYLCFLTVLMYYSSGFVLHSSALKLNTGTLKYIYIYYLSLRRNIICHIYYSTVTFCFSHIIKEPEHRVGHETAPLKQSRLKALLKSLTVAACLCPSLWPITQIRNRYATCFLAQLLCQSFMFFAFFCFVFPFLIHLIKFPLMSNKTVHNCDNGPFFLQRNQKEKMTTKW